MSLDTSRLTHIPFEDAATPRDGEVVVNRWWVVHPEKGLAVWGDGSFQCNTDRRLPDRLVKSYEGHEVRFIEVAFVGNVAWRYS